LVARDRLSEAFGIAGTTAVRLQLERMETPEAAEAVGFQGSPTILINGADAFSQQPGPGGLSCRLYSGPGGSPSVGDLVSALGGGAE
jgi:hypothetical protein